MKSGIKGGLILAMLIVAAGSATAAEITAACQGDGTVLLRVRFWEAELQPDWQGVVVERSLIGECGTGVLVTEEPLQLIPEFGMGDYEIFVPLPSETTTYRYEAKGLDAQGDLMSLTCSDYRINCFVIHSCIDDALMMRGTLVEEYRPFQLVIDLCEGSCWDVCAATATVGVPDLDPSEYEPLIGTGQIVNVYGVWDSYPPEVSWGCMKAARIEPVADCQGSVPLEGASWGAMKGTYR